MMNDTGRANTEGVADRPTFVTPFGCVAAQARSANSPLRHGRRSCAS